MKVVKIKWDIEAIGNHIDLDSFAEVQNAEQFECAVLLPSSWRMQAYWLMRVAGKIFRDYADAFKREEERMSALFKNGESASSSSVMHGQGLEDSKDIQALSIGLLLAGYAKIDGYKNNEFDPSSWWG